MALLLVHANETLTTDRLIDELWGERPPARAAKTVQMQVSRLRKALAADAAGGPVVTRERGYELRIDPEQLDSYRFERLSAEGASELAAGRPERAAAALERALSLWRDVPLSDLAYEPFAQGEISRLGDLRAASLEQLIEAKLVLGRHGEVISQLEALIAEHPYRERLRAQLMQALYRCERQADALQAYRDARRQLVGELGIEPGERLRELEHAILTQDPALAAPALELVELPPELDTATPLAGREAELDWLREHWWRARSGAGQLLLLTGGAGVGKTRLAAELAREAQREGGRLLFAAGGGPPDAARAALAGAREAGRPTLLVLDDVDRGAQELRAPLLELVDDLATLPVLVVATARDLALEAGATLALGPLDQEAVQAVARLYAGLPVDERVAAARAALDELAWGRAFELLQAADADAPLCAEDLDRLGEAALWAGHVDDCLAAWERAYAAHLAGNNRVGAAMTALRIARESLSKGEEAVAHGWYRRAAWMLQDEPESAAHGYLAQAAWFAAMASESWNEAAAEAERMVELGGRSGDTDLVGLGLSRKGHALVARGDVEEGQALLDEATTAAVAGDLSPYATFSVYCGTVSVCRDLTDYRRAGQWARAARRWCERRAVSGFPGICRVYTAEILRLRGDWEAAERDVRAACTELGRGGWDAVAGAGFRELGEIRLRVGDLAGAEEAFCVAYELGRDPQPGLALVRLAQGRAGDAAAALSTALEGSEDRLRRAQLLPAQVEVALAQRDMAVADSAAGELAAIAASFDTSALHAAAASARAAVALAVGDGDVALRWGREACRRWQEIELPYEAGRARLIIAEALALNGASDAAALELRATHAAFEWLGAHRDVQLVAERIRHHAGALAPRAGPSVRRTLVFTDVVRSTELIGVIGDQGWAAARGWHDAALRALFAAYHGEEVTHTGDGFFVAFPDARPALACAIEIQRTLERHRREQGFAVPVRIGIHAAPAAQTP